MRSPGCLVVGSANMDLVITAARFPRPGETILGRTFATIPGGKGANQAVCCARLGGRVEFIGKMGKDRFCDELREQMAGDGVSLRHLMTDPLAPTGVAVITVDAAGQNEIIVASGSNMHLTPRDIDAHRDAFIRGRILLLQLEVPIPTVQHAALLAARQGMQVVLNPAPAQRLPERLLRAVDILTPNENEAELLTGIRVVSRASAIKAARALQETGVRNVILTLGKKGCLLVTPSEVIAFPARRVKVVDTTAAGDAFNGALAFGLGQGRELPDAVMYATDVATLSVMRFGAQSSMPSSAEVDRFRRRAGMTRPPAETDQRS